MRTIPGCCRPIIHSVFRFHYCLVIALLVANGCAAVRSISEEDVQQKVSKIKLGLTTKEEIESLFGKEHTTEKFTWGYNLSDSAFGVSQSPRNGWSGLFPITVTTVPTNTRALITVTFTDYQTVSTLHVKRFFNTPFVNDYFFLDPDPELNSAENVGDSRVSGFDKSAGKSVLEDGSKNGQIVVEFKQPILHVRSINPYDRLSNAYRVFVKRETEFIETISASTIGNFASD